MKMTTYLFNDSEVFNREINATSWRDAIAKARDLYQIKGRIRLTAHVGDIKGWALSVSGYRFSLTKI